MSETSEVTRPLIKAIRAIPGCVAHRLHSGRFQVRRGWMHTEPEGTPDVLAILAGVPVYIETKVPKGVVSAEQRQLHDELRRTGARVEVARSVAEGLAVVRQVLEWKRGDVTLAGRPQTGARGT